MRCPRRLPKTMLAAILAVGIAFPAPALAFADDAADANKWLVKAAVDTTAISEGATQANDPALFDELVEGVDYRGLLVTLDEDSKINLLSEDGGESELAQGLADAGLAVTNQIESADGSTLAVADVADDMRASEAVAAAQEVPGVVSVQPNFVYRLVDEVPPARWTKAPQASPTNRPKATRTSRRRRSACRTTITYTPAIRTNPTTNTGSTPRASQERGTSRIRTTPSPWPRSTRA